MPENFGNSLEDLDIPAKSPEEMATDKLAAEAKELEAKAAQEKEAADKKLADEKAEAEKVAAGGDTKDTKVEDGKDKDDDEVIDFNAAVNKLHGFDDFKVDLPDGVDPLGPEAAFIREKALMNVARENFESHLKQTDPRGYSYLLHRMNGGDDETFFGKPSFTLPEYETFKNDVDLQKSILTRELSSKGLDKDSVDLIVEKAIKDNKLFERADAAYKGREKAEKDDLAFAEHNAAEREKQEVAQVGAMDKVVEDIVTNSKTSNIVIPDAKKPEFLKHIKESMYFDGQNFWIFKPLSKDNAADTIQAEYFGFVKGNLSEVVKRQATTQNANNMRRRMQKDDKVNPKTGDDNHNKGFTPISEI